MASAEDFDYIRFLMREGLVAGTVLELGSYSHQEKDGNTSALVRGEGLEWTGSDIEAGPGVDFTLDLLSTGEVEKIERRWDSVLVMNLLEHVYDPITVLRNACSLIATGGTCVVVAPAVWQLHDFPKDYWRPLPDFFEEFARREGLEYCGTASRWMAGGKLLPLLRDEAGRIVFPAGPEVFGSRRWLLSRVVNRLFKTAARQVFFPYIGLGVILRNRVA